MRTTFQLDPCTMLVVQGDIPRCASDNGSVHIQIEHTPLSLDGSEQPPADMPFACVLTPSHARAIASAILAAATDARQ